MSAQRVISQKAFDDIVLQNITELEMDPYEALEEAIISLKEQNVNLTLIVKDHNSYTNVGHVKHVIVELIDQLNNINNEHDLVNTLLTFQTECKDLAKRYLASQHNGYNTLIKLLKDQSKLDIQKHILITLTSLTKSQPNLFDSAGREIAVQFLNSDLNNESEPVHKALLQWLREICIKSESNRQILMENGLISNFFAQYLYNENLTSDTCALIQVLLLSDDNVDLVNTVPKSFDHAKIIADLYLTELINLLKDNRNKPSTLKELINTITDLLVHNDHCKRAQDDKILEIIHEYIQYFIQDQAILESLLKLVKSLARNDECKRIIGQNNILKLIMTLPELHENNRSMMNCFLECISFLTLREPINCQITFEGNISTIIAKLINHYEDDLTIMRKCTWVIKNTIGKNPHEIQKFLEFGTEQKLRKCLRTCKKQYEYDFKMALHVLGRNVRLSEEWTGHGGLIHSQEGNTPF